LQFRTGECNKPETVTVSQFHPAENVEQHVYFVEKQKKKKLIISIKNQDLSDVLVFSRTKHGADNVVALRKKTGCS
jgi:ATP-dependent RNA helicase RhlE